MSNDAKPPVQEEQTNLKEGWNEVMDNAKKLAKSIFSQAKLVCAEVKGSKQYQQLKEKGTQLFETGKNKLAETKAGEKLGMKKDSDGNESSHTVTPDRDDHSNQI
jgi:hypothetical protein